MDEEVIVSGATAEVSADNYDDFDQEIDTALLGDKLVQSNSQKGTLSEFQLYNGTHLLVRRGKLNDKHAQRYRINLAYVSSEPAHTRLVDWRWLIAALLFATVTIVFVVLGVLDRLAMDYVMIGGSISFTVTLLATLIFFYRLRDEFTFKGRFGGAELFVMENKRPSQRVFDGFFIVLQQAIENAAKMTDIEQQLTGELKMCRRLRDEHIISDDAYIQTRTAIFQHERYKA